MNPWGDIQAGLAGSDPIPDINILCRWLAKTGVPADFSCQTKNTPQGLRYIHRVSGNMDIYFIANKHPHPEAAVCTFRVSGKRPELWWPDTGRIESPAVYEEANGCVRVPIHFDPNGSVFVVFRQKSARDKSRITSVTRDGESLLDKVWKLESSLDQIWQPGNYILQGAKGKTRTVTIGSVPAPFEITGSWEVRFTPGWGAPEKATFEKLDNWAQRPEPGIKYFSGTATYHKTFQLNPSWFTPKPWMGSDPDPQKIHLLNLTEFMSLWPLFLDLGKVAVMAEFKLNGKNLGILWKPPFRVNISGAAKPGDNKLEVKVVNLWINRQIGDEQLPEDSERNPNS